MTTASLLVLTMAASGAQIAAFVREVAAIPPEKR
jgi:hypothetical protein